MLQIVRSFSSKVSMDTATPMFFLQVYAFKIWSNPYCNCPYRAIDRAGYAGRPGGGGQQWISLMLTWCSGPAIQNGPIASGTLT